MQVLCPSCETGYEIPALQRPRKLRCARCASEWRVVPQGEGTTVASAAGDAPELEAPVLEEIAAGTPTEAPSTFPGSPLTAPRAEQRLTEAATPGGRTLDRGDLLVALFWLASLLVIAAGLWALWHWRGPIGHRWPPSLRVYRLLPHGAEWGAR